MELRATRKIHPGLPIFRHDDGNHALLYAPGHLGLATRAQAEAVERLFSGGPGGPAIEGLASGLERAAGQATAEWESLAEGPFEPECLTVYLSNYCNLGCVYCFADRPGAFRGRDQPVIDPVAVGAAASLVARCCSKKARRFTLVVHGGGEPTLHWDRLQEVVAITREVARRHGLDWWSYIATNGGLPPDRVRWLGETFSQVGLSWDGPPDLHEAQRPRRDGAPTWASLERTADVLRSCRTSFTVRVTVMPRGVQRMSVAPNRS